MVEPYLHLNGRRMILTDETEVNIGNVVQILRKALPYHWKNRSEISYLWSYYKGRQPILNRVKEVRPEITNKIVENRANEIVSFKSGYLMGEPLSLKVSRVLALGFMTMYSSRSLMASSLRLVFTVLQPLWLNRVDIS